MIETIFRNSRFLVWVAVIVCLVATVLLYSASIKIIFHLCVEFIQQVPSSADGGKRLVVKLLKILDTLLIAVTFQIIAASLYQIFIASSENADRKLLSTLQINDFHDLKVILIQVSVVIMVILFLEQSVEVGATLETLYFGLAVGPVIAAAVYAWKNMSKHAPTIPHQSSSRPNIGRESDGRK